jgi:hypothetical protein
LGTAVALLVVLVASGVTAGVLKLNGGPLDAVFVALLPRAPLKDDDAAGVGLGAELVCLFGKPKLNFRVEGAPVDAAGKAVVEEVSCTVVLCGTLVLLGADVGFKVSPGVDLAKENAKGGC